MEPAKKQVPQPSGPKGRFLGLVATGKELYQVHLLETVGDRIVTHAVVDKGRENTQDGKTVMGMSLAVAAGQLTIAVSRRLIAEASSLWQP
jgi:hypothetical protein